MFSRKLLTLGLVAVAAICASSSSAKADISLASFFNQDFNPTTIPGATASVGGGAGNGNINVSSIGNYSSFLSTQNFLGYRLDYSISSRYTAASGMQEVILTGHLVADSSLGASNQSVFNLNLVGTNINQPGVGPALMSGTLTATFNGTENSAVISTQARLGSNINPSASDPTTSSAFLIAGVVGPNGTATSNTNNLPVTLTNPYALQSMNVTLTAAGAGTDISFTATARVFAVPEPASIVAGLMGLPCVAGLVGVVRRRLVGAVVA